MKKINLIPILALGIITILSLFTSCNKDAEIFEEKETPTINIVGNEIYSIVGIDCSTPENGDNPIDYAGATHNDILESVKNTYNENFEDLNFQQINTVVNSYDPNAITNPLSETEIDGLVTSLGTDDYNTYVNNMNLSTEAKSILLSLLNSILSNQFLEEYSYCNAKQLIMYFENQVIASETLSQLERDNLLATMSVMRYSIFYWDDYFSTLENENGMQRPSRIGAWFKRNWKIIVIGTADALGGTAGVLVATTNPVTAVVAVNAAVLGAAATSAAANSLIKNLGGG